jgi:hypothetical protein
MIALQLEYYIGSLAKGLGKHPRALLVNLT